MKKIFIHTAIALLALVVINLFGNYVYTRFDLTEDRRFTLSDASLNVANIFEKPVIVDVLLNGKLPPEFAKLRTETRQILEEFASENSHVKFNFVNPIEDASQSENVMAELQSLGLTPAQITVEDNGKLFKSVFVYVK